MRSNLKVAPFLSEFTSLSTDYAPGTVSTVRPERAEARVVIRHPLPSSSGWTNRSHVVGLVAVSALPTQYLGNSRGYRYLRAARTLPILAVGLIPDDGP